MTRTSFFSILRYLNALELTTRRHIARNIKVTLMNTLTKYEVAPPQILGIVTDSPSTMIRLREDFVKLPDFSHVVPLTCGLHAFNLIANDLINYKPLDKSVKPANDLSTTSTGLSIGWRSYTNGPKTTTYLTSSKFFRPSANTCFRVCSKVLILTGLDSSTVTLFVKTMPSTHLSCPTYY